MPPRRLSRNALLAVIPWLVPAVVAVFAVRIQVLGLGDNRYGVVALVGAVSGYLSLAQLGFEKGIGRYVSMFVAGGNGRAIRQCLRGVVMWFSGVGVVGGLVMWVLASWLVTGVFKVPIVLWPQAIDAFRIGGAAFALGSVAIPLSVVPTTFLRYDLVAGIRTTFLSLSLAGPAVLVMLGYGLLPVMWFSVALNGAAVLAWSIVSGRLVGSIPDQGPPFSEYRSQFLGFVLTEGATQVGQIVQAQTNKMVVGIAGGASQAAYFQVSYTVSDRANDLLHSLSGVLLPTVSQLVAGGEHDRIVELYERSSRLLFVLNASISGAIVVFSAPLLAYWIDPRYATEAAVALALFVLAQGIYAMSQAGSNVNLALGRPRANLAFSILSTIVSLATVYGLTVAYGITGTALSFLLASFVMPTFIHYTNRRILRIESWPVFRDCYLRTTLIAAAVSGAAWFVLRPLASSLPTTVALMGVTAAAILALCALFGAITPADRESLRAALRRNEPDAASDEDL